ncbi:hypothetical protein TNCV_1359461 [Trichonephila clavipes]|nr:hypothetical protein TNCV_1359461 [Trichonephila clavipes]
MILLRLSRERDEAPSVANSLAPVPISPSLKTSLNGMSAQAMSSSPSQWFKITRNEKVSNHDSIPITIDCNVVAFIVFEEGFHQPIKRTKQSVFLDVTVFRHTLVD